MSEATAAGAPRQTRIEKDSLGPLEVPADAYYGVQTARAVANFPISGERLHREMVRAVARIKIAAAKTHGDLGVLDKAKADAIVRAAEEVVAGKLDSHFVVDAYQDHTPSFGGPLAATSVGRCGGPGKGALPRWPFGRHADSGQSFVADPVGAAGRGQNHHRAAVGG